MSIKSVYNIGFLICVVLLISGVSLSFFNSNSADLSLILKTPVSFHTI